MRPNERDLFMANHKAFTVAVKDGMTAGLDAVLRDQGVTDGVRRVVTSHLDRFVKALDNQDRLTMEYVNPPLRAADLLTPNVSPGLGGTLEMYAEEFEKVATSPPQQRIAQVFREFVTELSAAMQQQEMTVQRGGR